MCSAEVPHNERGLLWSHALAPNFMFNNSVFAISPKRTLFSSQGKEIYGHIEHLAFPFSRFEELKASILSFCIFFAYHVVLIQIYKFSEIRKRTSAKRDIFKSEPPVLFLCLDRIPFHCSSFIFSALITLNCSKSFYPHRCLQHQTAHTAALQQLAIPLRTGSITGGFRVSKKLNSDLCDSAACRQCVLEVAMLI